MINMNMKGIHIDLSICEYIIVLISLINKLGDKSFMATSRQLRLLKWNDIHQHLFTVLMEFLIIQSVFMVIVGFRKGMLAGGAVCYGYLSSMYMAF